MDKKLKFILGFLFLFCVASFIAGVSLNSSAAFALSGASLLPFVGIFAVGVLDYKVGGTQLTLEKRVQGLEQENTELRKSVTALLKSLYVTYHAAGHWDCPTEDHDRLFSEYLLPITHLVAPGVKEQVDADIAKFMQQEKT